MPSALAQAPNPPGPKSHGRSSSEYQADRNPTNLRHCTIDGCTAPYKARGLCLRHYLRWWRGVTIDPPARTRRRLPASFKRTTG